MDADIDEGAKFGHVGHHTFEYHPRLQIPDSFYVLVKARGEEFVARVASGLTELFQNVVQGVHAGGEGALIDLLQQRWLSNELLDGNAEALGDLLDHATRLGMTGGLIEGVSAIANA